MVFIDFNFLYVKFLLSDYITLRTLDIVLLFRYLNDNISLMITGSYVN
jgi:hypothetical protein